MSLRGLYEEAVAENQSDLEECLRRYDVSLSENPVNLPILKRRVALLRTIGKPELAISSLVDFLNAVPTDAEAWCELAELYYAQGMSSQAIFSLEEALLIAPSAWNATSTFSAIKHRKGHLQASLPTVETLSNIERLNTFAKHGLEAIVKRRSLNRQLRDYAQGELMAAKELLGHMQQ
ncbi:uncharacterized protein ATNIH1004_011115 [Aspergillus tanneri]|uniref:ER membrane protein complex subunit 2 n=1 Tax=Aspergillus tanneri TaxID=1220188 RepID=A0A5M9MA12_9EURO|nr:uncharacterized protein ATNIH1004_011115 [Aspergillus tanneri]KAA8642174.1 hypothetical protein ATNIH1004_011115 [Aspergillus tanneri]